MPHRGAMQTDHAITAALMTAQYPSVREHPLVFWLLAAALVLTWSSGFVGIRYATDQAPVFMVLFWRSFVSGIALLPFAVLIGPKISLRAVAEQSLFGFLGMVLYLGGFAIAIGQGVPTGLVALMADLVPLAIAGLSMPMLGLNLTPRQWLGTAIGLSGVAVVSVDVLAVGDAPLFAYVLPVLGMVSFAFATVLQKRMGKTQIAIHQSLSLQCLSASAVFAMCALVEGSIVPPLTPAFAFGIGWLVVFATFGAWGVYYLCLRRYAPARVSSVIYLSPPVTMIWAWGLFDEPLSVIMGVGLIITLAGVYLTASVPAE